MTIQCPVSRLGLTEIFPTFFGYEACAKNHSYGPATRDCYLIHYILEGKGIFHRGEQTYHLSKGQCFLICPQDVTFYQADEENPWHYLWIAFDGSRAEEFLRRAGLSGESPIFSSAGVSSVFERLQIESQNGYQNNTELSYYLLSKIYELFYHLSIPAQKEHITEHYIEKAKNYLTTLYSQDISIEKLANYCCLDRRYLCRIFKDKTGVTLQQYLLNIRLEKARSLVVSSKLSISDIARSVGYRDLYHFSRMFKNKYGKSPLILRNAYE